MNWFEGVFFFRTKNKNSSTTVDYTVRSHQETGPNKTKIELVEQNQQQEQRTILSVRVTWQKADCFKYHWTTEPMSRKKCVNIHCEEKTLWGWPI